MKISEISIKNPVFAWMLMLGLILFGMISLGRIGISELPDMDFPVVTVNVTYRGVVPEIMESDVVDIIEESLMTVQSIKSITSVSKQEMASVTVEFELDRDIDQAVQDVQAKLAQVQQRLPKDMDPPVVVKVNPEDNPVMWISLSGNKTVREINQYARDHVKDKLQTVKGVGEIIISGFVEPNLRIWINVEKLNAAELTVQDILGAISSNHVEIPTGRIETSTVEYNLRYLGEAKTAEEFENILITRRGGNVIYKPIRIGDVAKVELGLDDIRRLSRTDGKNAIGLGIKKQRGFNSVAVADAVQKKMVEINQSLPEGYSIQVNFDSTRFIRHSIAEMQFELILSALLTGIVCFLFLASINSTFNILMAIPTSIVGCFMFMGWLGFTLNNFTLLALTLSIGIVVDDAIMVLENIVRHQEMGKNPMRAARDGSKEIASAAIATTVALIAIFVPVVFMQGVQGKLFYQFGMVLSITVALSLLEAVTLTPMRSSRMRLAGHRDSGWAKASDEVFKKMADRYRSILNFCLKHSYTTISISIVIFLSSLSLAYFIKKEFVPVQDQGMFLVNAIAPLGSSIDYTSEKMKKAEAVIAQYPEVQRYFVAVGGFGGGEVNKAIMFVSLHEYKDRPKNEKLGRKIKQDEIMQRFSRELNFINEDGLFLRQLEHKWILGKKIQKFRDPQNVIFIMQDLSMRGFTSQRGFPIEFNLRGPQWNKLTEVAQDLVTKMRMSKTMAGVDMDFQFGQSEIEIIPKRQAAAEHGVQISDIGTVVSAMIGGVKQGKFTEEGHRNDIRIRVEADDRQSMENILKLHVRNNKGELIKLSDVAEVKMSKTLQSISRRDRERVINITSNLQQGVSQEEAIKELKEIAKTTLPEDYRMVLSGTAEALEEVGRSFLFALLMGIVIAYMVLGTQYNSFIHPITVLLALPFSFSGAFIALLIFQQSLNLYSAIGMILLMGITKKNSILLVDFANQRRVEGLSAFEAMLRSGPDRLRPILMTSITVIVAAIPSALGLGSGSEVRISMSVVIMGGVFVSTFMTLFVVPCAYVLFSKLERKQATFDDD